MPVALSSELEQLVREKLSSTEFRSQEDLVESISQLLASYDVTATPAQVRALIGDMAPGTPRVD